MNGASMPGNWPRVNEIFHDALSRAAADRDAFLDEACAGDRALRDEVASLLRAHDEAGDFLDAPVAHLGDALLPPAGPLGPGRQVGPYLIERELGRGGMGVVYLAKDQRLGRNVALKALAPGYTSDPGRRRRLQMEARAASVLSHPGIATVYALEEIDGHLYLANEFVQGETLRDLIQAGSLSLERLVDVAAQVARALAVAHAAGIVHRDLKPENLIVAASGTVKVLDFGIARLPAAWREGDRRATEPGTIVGTPAYMAPEQLEGEEADARADLFALGVVVYEAASGTHPFEGATSISTATRILTHNPPPLQALNPLVSAALDRIVRRCLQKQVARRYQSADDLAADLEHLGRSPRRTPEEGRGDDTAGVSYRTVWRVHQVGVMVVYGALVYPAWMSVKWTGAWWMMPVFLGAVVMAVLNGTLRTHLLFTERFNRPAVTAELRQTARWVRASDVAYGTLLLVAAVPIAWTATVTAAVLAGFGIGGIVTALIIEPSTTRSAFGRRVSSGARRIARDRSGR